MRGEDRPPTPGAIQTWLVTYLADLLGVAPDKIDVREPFESYGLSSKDAVILSGDLEVWLERRLEPTLAWAYPTIEALAHYLAQGITQVEDRHSKQGLDDKGLPDYGPRIPEPIAIVGIGCRFPGANGVDAFWQLLKDGRDAITEVPRDRWDVDQFYDPDPSIPGKMNTRWGGFVEGVDQFDCGFFGISPREAVRMDPQQRLLLQVAWEALEDAGQPPDELAGSLTGVFVGISSNDYAQFQFTDPTLIDAYAGTGNAHSIAANRLSYVLDLQGPSLAVDTACSSSLVAVHMACQSLHSAECDLALAGGVNLLLTPGITINFTKAQVMAPDGRSKAFDARANGYVRGEGAGIVVLRLLSRALADGDSIYAVIRGSAINHDGRSNGLMAPSPRAQEAVLREAYRRAGISPGQVQYVEAHGTGTFLGDPIEAKALGAVLATDRPPDSPCALGSVKTNIGHLEAAAGIAGLIKVALSLKHQVILPSLHFEEPNPHIPFDNLPLYVQQTLSPWPAGSGPALAGVSSFGFGGTNAHMVLQEAPRTLQVYQRDASTVDRVELLPLSTRSPEALRSLAEAYKSFLASGGDRSATLRDVCYTASMRRSHHDHRLAIVGHSHDELVECLHTYLQGRLRPGTSSGQKVPGQRPRLVFVFSGQGSQWPGMGRELLAQEPIFRQTLLRCQEIMRSHVDWALLEELAAGEDRTRLAEISVVQPILFAIQVGLAVLWRAWGIEPDAVVGHSMGEVAAAHIAGALSLEDAVRIICLRSRLMKRKSGQGAMVATELTVEEACQVLAGYEDRVSIAASNSPTSTVLSGDPAALEEIAATLRDQDVFCRFVKVGVAAHSPHMEHLRPELVQALEEVRPSSPSVAIYSTVTGKVHTSLPFDADYWGRNLREPVLFSTAMKNLLEDGHDIFLEISPHPILASAIQQGLAHHKGSGTVLPSMRRKEAQGDGQSEETVIRGTLGTLYTLGCSPDWSKLYSSGGQHVRLPSYPWQQKRYWLDTEIEVRAKVKDAGKPALCEGQEVAARDLDAWLYELQWRPQERGEPEPPLPTGPGSWLIFADRCRVGEKLAEYLAAHAERPVLVWRGGTYERLDDHRFRIRSCRQDVGQLLETALGDDQPACQGVVHLWSLDAPTGEEMTARSLQEAQLLGCGSVLPLLQEMDQILWNQMPRLWLVTQGAQPVGNGDRAPLSLAQSSLWGLGRTMAQEHPALWGGLIDLDPTSCSRDLDDLWEEIRQPQDEDQIAFRQGQRYVARLVRRRRSTGQAVPYRWRTDGSYLITGGLGDLGLQVARWMVEQGARRLILMGRTELPPRSSWIKVEGGHLARRIAAIRELEALGASVHLAAVDVADEAQLANFLNTFRCEGWPPIQGVMHLAGVVEPQPLRHVEAAELDSVLRPKVLGGWHLHHLLEDAPLDFFVLFSSAASLLSSPLLGSYAAANAFLDALALYRRSLDLPALSINWGYWSGVGMAARYGQEMGRELVPRGMRSLSPEQGLAALGHLLPQDAVQVAVLPVNWQEWSQFHPEASKSPMLADLMPTGYEPAPAAKSRMFEVGMSPGKNGTVREPFRRDMLELPTGELEHSIQIYIKQEIADVLYMEAEAVPLDCNLVDLGLDSLMAMELIRHVEQDLQLRLYPREIFEQPSVSALAEYLTGELERVRGRDHERTAHIPPSDVSPVSAALAAWAQRSAPRPLVRPAQRNPGMIFLLSGPRSGSTLLRVMLAGHPALFSPPELHLLPFDSMQHRQKELGLTYLGEGLQRAFMELMELDANGGQSLVDALVAQDLPIQRVYSQLQELAGERLLVDKSPSYGANIETLERAELFFEDPKYIHLVRHPYSAIESSVRIRIDKLLGAGDVDPHEFSEQIWATMNRRIHDFLQQVEPSRRYLLRFEDLVVEPARVARELCQFIGIPYDNALLTPYEGNRMTDGIHAVSMSTGDPNFLKHGGIDSELGERWKEIELPRQLGPFARQVAEELGYELPREQGTVQHSIQTKRPSLVVDVSWDEVSDSSALVPIQPHGVKQPFFLVHPASGLVYMYCGLAQFLGDEQPLYALQDPSLGGEREPYTRIEEYADEYLGAIRSIQPEGPYLLGGWSFGGHVAFKMAQCLHDAGQEVKLVVAIDTEAPVAGRKLSLKQHLAFIMNRLRESITFVGDVIPYVFDGLYIVLSRARMRDDRPGAEMSRWEYVRGAWSAAMYRRLARRAGMVEIISQETRLRQIRLPAVRRILYVLSRHLGVIAHFHPQVYPGKLILLRARQQVARQFYDDVTLGWRDLVAGGVEVHTVPGNHATLFQEPYIQAVAATLKACIENVEAAP